MKEKIKNMKLSHWVLLVCIVLLALFPILEQDYMMSVLVLASIYTVYVAAWDLLSGFTGQENFGYSLFIGGGAYAVGFLVKSGVAVNPVAGILLGGVVAALFGIIIGVPCLRLKGPYLALATMAAAAIAERAAIIFSKVTGGEDGIFGIPPLTGDPTGDYYLALVFMLVCVAILYAIGRSDIGLILKAVKQDEAAAESLGMNTTVYKVGAFIVSAFFGGMAGSFNAHYLQYIGPDAMLASSISLNIIILAVVGGTGTILNAAGGAYLLTLLGEFLKNHFGDYHLLIYSGLLILTILFMPHGFFKSAGKFLSKLTKKQTNTVAEGGGSSASHS